jgi:competence ComEA-like helix-hairpin-helix protein
MTTPRTRWAWQWNQPQLMALLVLSALLAILAISTVWARPVVPDSLGDYGRTHWEHIDPNTASWASLQRLPGVGPVLASRIIAHRRQGNHFTTIHDMDDVKGIGEVRMRRIEPYVHFPAASCETP